MAREMDLNLSRPTEMQARPAEQAPVVSVEDRDAAPATIAARKARFGSCVMGFNGPAARVLDRF